MRQSKSTADSFYSLGQLRVEMQPHANVAPLVTIIGVWGSRLTEL
jgi:hypothetical protein